MEHGAPPQVMRGYLDLSSGTITSLGDHDSGASCGDLACEQDASNDCRICERELSTGAVYGFEHSTKSIRGFSRLTRGRERVLPTGDLARLVRGGNDRGGRLELLGRAEEGAGWWKLKVMGASVDAVQVVRREQCLLESSS